MAHMAYMAYMANMAIKYVKNHPPLQCCSPVWARFLGI